MIVGADRAASARLGARRSAPSSSGDHAPRRARFASDPAPLAVAWPSRRATGQRGAQRRRHAAVHDPPPCAALGRDVEATPWSPRSRGRRPLGRSASSPRAPPGSLPMHVLTRTLFTTWPPRRCLGRGADGARALPGGRGEPRPEPDRAPLREMVLEACRISARGAGCTGRRSTAGSRKDARIAGIERLLKRWGERAAVEAPPVLEVARRIALESRPVLGIIDIGATGTTFDVGATGTVRQERGRRRRRPRRASAARAWPSPRRRTSPCASRRGGRALLSGVAPTSIRRRASHRQPGAACRRGDDGCRAPRPQRLRRDRPRHRPARSAAHPAVLARAVSAGVEADTLRARIEAVAPLPDTISRMWCRPAWSSEGHARRRQRLPVGRRHRGARAAAHAPPASELFVDPSPPRPAHRARRGPRPPRASLPRAGVEIEIDGAAVRARNAGVDAAPRSARAPRAFAHADAAQK